MTKDTCCKRKESCGCKSNRPISRASWQRNQTVEPHKEMPIHDEDGKPNPTDRKLEPQ